MLIRLAFTNIPVTFTATPGLDVSLGCRSGQPQNATELLQQCSKEEHANRERIFQSSFSDNYLSNHNVKASPNGFVWAVIEAYNEHRNLVIRPDDVWLAILTQFSIYVNAHAEEHRRQFVTHDGQIELEILHEGRLWTYDWADFPQDMVSKLGQLVKKPDFQKWILPNFSTTKANDKVVCSIVMMGTLQHYFSYTLVLRCGMPAVTLLGEKADWVKILNRIEKLSSFGEETHEWYELLLPVISHFIKAFDSPDSTENQDFWQKAAHQTNNKSGVDYLTGWITAFCFWDEQGQRLHEKSGYKGTKMNGIEFSSVDINAIPAGFAAVPVKIDDNRVVYPARMVAGSIATRGYIDLEGSPNVNKRYYNTLQPENGWCVFKLKGQGKKDDGSAANKKPKSNSDMADAADSGL